MSAPQSIAVFRARGLGDLLCAVPTLRALRRGWPHARVTLIGLPWARELAARFPVYVDEFVEFPGFPGFPGLRERRREPQAVLEFLRGARGDADLALQLLAAASSAIRSSRCSGLGARRYFREAITALRPGRLSTVARRRPGCRARHACSRRLACRLERAEPRSAGGPGRLAELAAVADERELPRGSYVCVHPGAELGSRRWYPERFAVVADALAARGFRVVVTGTGGEAAVARRVVERMRAPAVDLVGRTTLGGLTALVDGARLVVTNDTGVRHVAAARGTPCVAVAAAATCGAGRRSDGAAAASCRSAVPPCVRDHCPVGHGCARSVQSATSSRRRTSCSRSRPLGMLEPATRRLVAELARQVLLRARDWRRGAADPRESRGRRRAARPEGDRGRHEPPRSPGGAARAAARRLCSRAVRSHAVHGAAGPHVRARDADRRHEPELADVRALAFTRGALPRQPRDGGVDA